MVRAGPDRVAVGISERTGVPVIAARDRMSLPLPPPLQRELFETAAPGGDPR